MHSLTMRIIKRFFPLFVGFSVLFFTLYVLVQQEIRLSGNDPQIQMAEDQASSLEKGINPAFSPNIDIKKSLSPFFIIYDIDGKEIESTAVLTEIPSIPKGVLSAAKMMGENRLTWQPEPGIRIAAVVVPYQNGYVLAGRNMREIERREALTHHLMLLGYTGCVLLTFFTIFFMKLFCYPKK